MSYRFADSLRAVSGWTWFRSAQNKFRSDPAHKLLANLYDIYHFSVLRTPDVGQRNCPKYIGFYSKNKFEK
jgi:hypothetical protein